MSDLTRRVLEADQYMDRSPIPDWNKFDDARLILEDAAPTLARQVEAVEKLADDLDAEGNAFMDDADPGRAKTSYAHSARIRTALNSVD